MNNGTYRPKKAAMEAYAEMQNIAIKTGKTLLELSKEMGFSCPYDWQQALMKE